MIEASRGGRNQWKIYTNTDGSKVILATPNLRLSRMVLIYDITSVPGGEVHSMASRLFTQQFIQAPIKKNIKARRHWPLCGEFTGDRWIPRTKGP